MTMAELIFDRAKEIRKKVTVARDSAVSRAEG